MTNEFAQRVQEVQERIAAASRVANRSPEEITLIVVSKFHPESVVRKIFDCGITNFGENRHQEAGPKAESVSDLDIVWHFVGQLQSKKARQAANYASVFHSLDRDSVITALGKSDKHLSGFVQINMTDDPGRGGISPDDIEKTAELVMSTPNIKLLGVMAVAPLEEEAASAFERLAGYSDRIQAVNSEASFISAGMTHDFEEAIQFGATHLRIGSAITGNRPDTQ